jgi:hypothetical protein
VGIPENQIGKLYFRHNISSVLIKYKNLLNIEVLELPSFLCALSQFQNRYFETALFLPVSAGPFPVFSDSGAYGGAYSLIGLSIRDRNFGIRFLLRNEQANQFSSQDNTDNQNNQKSEYDTHAKKRQYPALLQHIKNSHRYSSLLRIAK